MLKVISALALSLIASVALAYTVTLNWTAPTTNTDGTPIMDALAYNIYSWPAVSGNCPPAPISPTQLGAGVTALTFTTGTLPAGSGVCFGIETVDTVNGSASVLTNPLLATIPGEQPNPPTGLTATVNQ